MTYQTPKDYRAKLNNLDTQKAIELIKNSFQEQFAAQMHLTRVSAPLFVKSGSGFNDNLTGVERPVSFEIPSIKGNAEIVHSLAKWKRLALSKYGFAVGQGLFTDMNAIRRDETLDNLHSVYVDQWDWERVIEEKDRTMDYLCQTVREIVKVIDTVTKRANAAYPALDCHLDNNVAFVTSDQLVSTYPHLNAAQREAQFVKEHHTSFIMQIGHKLKDGKPHDKRAPDYDDWDLNGDLLVWNNLLNCPFELSSMGIRVDSKSLQRQLKEADRTEMANLSYHKMVLENKLPLTIGGGIGQSRLCMFIMQCAHIGEVQASLWDENTLEYCKQNKINLL